MIKMTYNEARNMVRNMDLMNALITTPMTLRTGYNLRKILDKIGRAVQEFDLFEENLKLGVAQKYAIKDEKGEFIFEVVPASEHAPEQKIYTFSEENRAQANKEVFLGISEFSKRELTIDRNPVDLSEEKITFRMVDLPLIEKIIVQLEPGNIETSEASSDAPTGA